MGRLKAAFVASLALNLLFVGVIAGQWSNHREPPQHRPQFTAPNFDGTPVAMVLTPEHREVFEATLSQSFKQNKALRQQQRNTHHQLIDTLSTEPLNTHEYQRLVGKLKQAKLQEMDTMLIGTFNVVSTFSPEERQAVATTFKERHKKRFAKHHH